MSGNIFEVIDLFGKDFASGQKRDEPLDHIQKTVLESVENFARGEHQADDLTLLVVRYRGTGLLAVTDTDVSATKNDVVV